MNRAAVVVLALVVAGCSPAAEIPRAVPTPPETVSASPSLKTPNAPPPLKLFNNALGRSNRALSRAIRDVKRLGYWHRLTGHLYVVQISSRPGLHDVPPDNHLADAFLRAYIDDEGQGAMCDIRFYPAALRQDLENWRTAHNRGLFDDPPPSLRTYWASILGHELAHCLGHGKGERVALDWETRIRHRMS